MTLEELIYKYQTKNEIIIKRKNEILDFTVTTGIILKHDLVIYADSEELRVGNTIVKMTDLRKLYFFKVRNRYGGYACSLEIVGKSMVNSKSITITTLSEEDLDKIDKLFDYFIFSNEKDYNKLTSPNYEFLIDSNSNICKRQLNIYTEEQKNCMYIKTNNKEYIFYKILPKTYYQKYSKKKYLLFETRFDNQNYMDVWIEKNAVLRKFKLIKLLIIFSTILAISFFGYLIVKITKDFQKNVQEMEIAKEQEETRREEILKKEEQIKELLPYFNIYYEDGFIYRDEDDFNKPDDNMPADDDNGAENTRLDDNILANNELENNMIDDNILANNELENNRLEDNILVENGLEDNRFDDHRYKNADLICVFEFEDGEKLYRVFDVNDRIDLNRVDFKDNRMCKVYMVFRGNIVYDGEKEFVSDAVISNVLEIEV